KPAITSRQSRVASSPNSSGVTFTRLQSLMASSPGYWSRLRRRSFLFLKFQIGRCVSLLCCSLSDFQSQYLSRGHLKRRPRGSSAQKLQMPREHTHAAARGFTSSSSELCCLSGCSFSGDPLLH